MTEPAVATRDAQERSAAEPPAPVSTARALTTVLLAAVLVATGLVVWIRSGDPAAERPVGAGLDEPPPESLPGGIPFGEVPSEVADVVGTAPVVGAVLLDRLPEDFAGCGMDHSFDEQATLESAVVTPDGLAVSLVGEMRIDGLSMPPPPRGPGGPRGPSPGPPPDMEMPEAMETQRMRATCTAAWRNGHWENHGGSFGPVEAGEDVGAGATCCDERGLGTAFTRLPVPLGAAWLLQERGDWWLAIPVGDAQSLSVSWKYRDGGFGGSGQSTHVLWVDEHGVVIDERYPSI